MMLCRRIFVKACLWPTRFLFKVRGWLPVCCFSSKIVRSRVTTLTLRLLTVWRRVDKAQDASEAISTRGS